MAVELRSGGLFLISLSLSFSISFPDFYGEGFSSLLLAWVLLGSVLMEEGRDINK